MLCAGNALKLDDLPMVTASPCCAVCSKKLSMVEDAGCTGTFMRFTSPTTYLQHSVDLNSCDLFNENSHLIFLSISSHRLM
jgi:hypothetical protein